MTQWIMMLAGNIDEEGCRRSIHCEGGALCVSGRCSCPSTHIAVAGNTKCAMRGGQSDHRHHYHHHYHHHHHHHHHHHKRRFNHDWLYDNTVMGYLKERKNIRIYSIFLEKYAHSTAYKSSTNAVAMQETRVAISGSKCVMQIQIRSLRCRRLSDTSF